MEIAGVGIFVGKYIAVRVITALVAPYAIKGLKKAMVKIKC